MVVVLGALLLGGERGGASLGRRFRIGVAAVVGLRSWGCQTANHAGGDGMQLFSSMYGVYVYDSRILILMLILSRHR